MMEESVSTFETHLTAVMDSLIRASVCEITKLFQETVNDYLVELSLNKRENESLKLRLRLTENKLRAERKYGLGWAAHRRNAGLAAAEEEEAAAEGDGVGVRHKRKVGTTREYLLRSALYSPGSDVLLKHAQLSYTKHPRCCCFILKFNVLNSNYFLKLFFMGFFRRRTCFVGNHLA